MLCSPMLAHNEGIPTHNIVSLRIPSYPLEGVRTLRRDTLGGGVYLRQSRAKAKLPPRRNNVSGRAPWFTPYRGESHNIHYVNQESL